MNKLFIFQKSRNNYYGELERGYRLALKKSDSVRKAGLNKLSADYLINNKIDVVVTNGLPKEWYLRLKALKIVTVTLEDFSRYRGLADILIDYRDKSNIHYFTGIEYSLLKAKDFEAEFIEIINLIKKLKWDSGFWNFPVAYVSCKYLTESIIYRIEKFIKKENIKLIEYLCNCHDNRSVKTAGQNGFYFADIRLTFEKELDKKSDVGLKKGFSFYPAQPSDIKRIRSIADNVYKNSRYFFDENFNRKKVNEFYLSWVEKAVLGQFDDVCYCLFHKEIPVGFCTIKYNISDSANVGLVGISEKYRRQGLGKTLLFLVFNKLMDKGFLKVNVVTQGRNYAAQRLYQRAGFITKKTELWYHKWLQDGR